MKFTTVKRTLWIQYAWLTFSMSIVGIASVMYLFRAIDASYDGVHRPMITADQFVHTSHRSALLQELSHFGGWVEMLDNRYHVVHVLGTPQQQTTEYNHQELAALLQNNSDIQDFYYSIADTKVNGSKAKALVILPMESVDNGQLLDNEQRMVRVRVDIAKTIGGFVCLACLIIYLFGRLNSRKMVTPLQQITTGIRNMADNEYHVALDFNAPSEFLEIRDALNDMSIRLKRAQQEKLEAEEGKKQMLTDIAHDLKTPVASIMGLASALTSGLIVESQYQQYFHTMNHKANRVNTLVDTLLEIALLDNPTYTLNLQSSDICEWMRQIIAEYYAEIENRQIELVVDIPEYQIPVQFDGKQLHRAVANLISNAIMHNSKGIHLRISVAKQLDGVYIVVADNGTKIPSEIRARIFEPFVRADSSRSSEGGLGLGLSISKKIVEKHGGDLVLTDTQHETNVFEIRLPV